MISASMSTACTRAATDERFLCSLVIFNVDINFFVLFVTMSVVCFLYSIMLHVIVAVVLVHYT